MLNDLPFLYSCCFYCAQPTLQAELCVLVRGMAYPRPTLKVILASFDEAGIINKVLIYFCFVLFQLLENSAKASSEEINLTKKLEKFKEFNKCLRTCLFITPKFAEPKLKC